MRHGADHVEPQPVRIFDYFASTTKRSCRFSWIGMDLNQ